MSFSLRVTVTSCVASRQVFNVGEQGGGDDDDDEDSFEAPTRGRGGAGGRTIRSKSIGIQFKESLAELMATISITHPRCFDRLSVSFFVSSVGGNGSGSPNRLVLCGVLRRAFRVNVSLASRGGGAQDMFSPWINRSD